MRHLTASILLLALALLPNRELSACGPFPPDDEPGFGGDGILALFSPWYVPDPLFTDLIDDADGLTAPFTPAVSGDEAVSRIHTEEWLAYLGWSAASGPKDDLAEALDADDPSGEFRRKILPLVPKETPADRRTGTVNYLRLMGEANKAVTKEREIAWSYGGSQTQAPDWEGIARKAVAGASGAKDAFLKARYAFQAVRAASMARDPDQAMNLYNAYFASGNDASLLRYRAMGYAARAWIQKGQPQTAFGYYVAIFDQCPPLSGQVLLSLRAMDISDETFDRWTEALDSPHRRAVAAFAHALVDPHRDLLRYVEQILRWEPASPHAAKLLLGMVRSVEVERLPRLLASLAAPGKPLQEGTGIGWPDRREAPAFDDARMARALQTVRQARAGSAVRYPGLWLAAEAHLLFLAGDPKAARAALDQGSALTGLHPLESGLLHLEATLLGWSPAGDGSWQPRLADDLRFLDLVATDRRDARPRRTFLSLLGHQHLAAGDLPRAALGFSAARNGYTASFLLDMYGEPEDLAALETLLRKPRTAEDRILLELFPHSADEVRYLTGVRMMRRGGFQAALEAWESLPDRFWDQAETGPTGDAPLLHARINFENTLFTPDKGWQTLSRKDAAGKLAALAVRLSALRGKTAARDRQTAADTAASIGSVLMSTPYLGYADILWDGEMVYSLKFLDHGKWPFLLQGVGEKARAGYERFRREYDHLAAAAAYFEEAGSLEPNREKAARHALTAIQCWDGFPYYGGFMENPSEQKTAMAQKSREAFSKLYGKTAFYKAYLRQVGGGCPGIDAYR